MLEFFYKKQKKSAISSRPCGVKLSIIIESNKKNSL